MTASRTLVLHWLAGLFALAAFFSADWAAAADRIVWKKTTVNENLESWRLDMEFHFSSAPDIAHVPIQFEFQQTIYYENTLEDGMDKPRQTATPVEFKQPLIETQDVGFLDPGSGKTMARTKFTFKLTRARGFEAGEYKVTVKNKRTGNKLGTPTTLILKGENEVVDRRAIVVEEKKKKKEDKPKDAQDEYKASEDPNSEEYWSGASAPEEKEEDLPPPAHMQERPGACGCRTVGSTSNSGLGLLLLGAFASSALLRRRRVTAARTHAR
jgi:MYXO-CTERM domain-containing protein